MRRPFEACVLTLRAPIDISYPCASFANSWGTSAGSCWPSASMRTNRSPLAARAPLFTAAPFPREYGCDITRAPAARAISGVPSRDPSSTTRISASGRIWLNCGRSVRRPTASSRAGRTILTLSVTVPPGTLGAANAAGYSVFSRPAPPSTRLCKGVLLWAVAG